MTILLRLSTLAICLVTLHAPAMADTAPRGQAIFDTQCKRCHSRGAKSLKADPEQLQQALKSVRQHRFNLNEADLAELSNYLREVR